MTYRYLCLASLKRTTQSLVAPGEFLLDRRGKGRQIRAEMKKNSIEEGGRPRYDRET